MFDEMSPMIVKNITGGIDKAIEGIDSGLEGMTASMPAGMPMAAMGGMGETVGKMQNLSKQLTAVKDAIPDAFAEAGDNYATAVKDMGPEIEDTYQATLNTGYRNMYLFLVGANALGLLLLMLYKEPKTLKKKEETK